jgi:hypothetical protein
MVVVSGRIFVGLFWDFYKEFFVVFGCFVVLGNCQ